MTTPHWHFIDESERRKFQDPDAILGTIGLKAGGTFVDMGCGEGFFALPAARLVGPRGKVYGVDIDRQAIEEVRRKAAKEKLSNLELIVSAAEKAVPCNECADVLFFGIVLHDFEDPRRVLKNARKIVKANGLLVNLDWKKVPMPFGPPLTKKFDEKTASRLIESAGFKVESVQDSGVYHYIVTARPA